MNFTSLRKIDFFKNHIFEHHSETGSTNDLLKTYLAKPEPQPHLLVADQQTAGRGQYQRTWLSAPKKSLLFSFSADLPPQCFPPSLTAGTALASFLSTHLSPEAKTDLWLKWPNDLWYKNKKMAGILTELTHYGSHMQCVVGIGLNLKTLAQKQPHAAVADFSNNLTASDILLGFCQAWNRIFRLDSKAQIALWANHAPYFFGKSYRILSGNSQFTGTPLALSASGALIVLDPEGKRLELNSASLQPLFI